MGNWCSQHLTHPWTSGVTKRPLRVDCGKHRIDGERRRLRLREIRRVELQSQVVAVNVVGG